MSSRRKSREAVVKTLYQADLAKKDNISELLKEASEGASLDENSLLFAERLATGAVENLENIDSIISRLLTNWTPERLGYMERAILRMAIYEMKYESGTPGKVVLDEAIELAKRYCDIGSAKLINGVLDKVLGENDQQNRNDSTRLVVSLL